ncbi:MAG: DUF2254 domain-containing protein [Gammaproteobacteria bacterium]
MRIKLLRIWEELTRSFWFTPTLIAIGGLVLAVVLVLAEPWVRPLELPYLSKLYLSDPAGARSILATIASSAITVAGVVFSITIVVLNMASAQFGPRLLPNFMQHGATQAVLGTFMGTFIYCLTSLSMIHVGNGSPQVPQLAVAMGLVLGVASFGVLIYFIHHVAIFIQAPRIIDDVGRQLIANLESAFPARDDSRPSSPPQPGEPAAGAAIIEGRPVCASSAGYVQAVDREGLLDAARERDLHIRLLVHPGDYVSTGDRVAEVQGDDPPEDNADGPVLSALLLGPQRTQTQDPAFGVYQLVEIGLRALSPGINDPFTAVSCIDRLGNAVGELARRQIPSHLVWDDEGQLRLQVKPYTYASIVGAAFDQLRRASTDHLDVTLRLLAVLGNLLERELPSELRQALVDQARAVREAADRNSLVDRDRDALEAAWKATRADDDTA